MNAKQKRALAKLSRKLAGDQRETEKLYGRLRDSCPDGSAFDGELLLRQADLDVLDPEISVADAEAIFTSNRLLTEKMYVIACIDALLKEKLDRLDRRLFPCVYLKRRFSGDRLQSAQLVWEEKGGTRYARISSDPALLSQIERAIELGDPPNILLKFAETRERRVSLWVRRWEEQLGEFLFALRSSA